MIFDIFVISEINKNVFKEEINICKKDFEFELDFSVYAYKTNYSNINGFYDSYGKKIFIKVDIGVSQVLDYSKYKKIFLHELLHHIIHSNKIENIPDLELFIQNYIKSKGY